MRANLMLLIFLLTGISASAFAQNDLSVRNDRLGGFYTRGETATFEVANPGDKITITVVDPQNQAALRREQATTGSRTAAVAVETGRLPRLGLYRISAVASSGKAAQTTFAVAPPSKDIVAPRDSRFGVIFQPKGANEQAADIARSLRSAGARWIDIDIPLARINPSEGVYDWETTGRSEKSNFDAFVRAAHNENLCLMLKFLGQADWISKRTGKDVHASWDAALNLSPPSDPKKWAEVVAAVVKRYGDLCDTWEIGNEPEGHGYFKGSDEEYMAYLETTANAIRATQPNATIVAASLYNGGGVLPRLVRRPDLFDIMSVHYLTGPGPAESPIEHYRNALADSGTSKPIWNTESRGNKCAPTSPDESSAYRSGARNQSPIKAFARNFALGVPRVFVFSWNLDEEPSFVNEDYSPKLCAVEYRTMTDYLEGARFVRAVAVGENLSGFQFRRGGRDFLVAWSDRANYEPTVSIPLLDEKGEPLGRDAFIVDATGNTRKPVAEYGRITIDLTYRPIFIFNLKAEALSAE
jgi:hypothetical protein